MDTHSEGEGTKRCMACSAYEDCPEKLISLKYPTCKYGEYNCPNSCAEMIGDTFGSDQQCCLGMACNEKETCVNTDECKKTGMCRDDNECCDKYGCFNGKVIYAAGQKCDSDSDRLHYTKCHSFLRLCY